MLSFEDYKGEEFSQIKKVRSLRLGNATYVNLPKSGPIYAVRMGGLHAVKTGQEAPRRQIDAPLGTVVCNGHCGSAISRRMIAIIKNMLKQIERAKISSVLRSCIGK